MSELRFALLIQDSIMRLGIAQRMERSQLAVSQIEVLESPAEVDSTFEKNTPDLIILEDRVLNSKSFLDLLAHLAQEYPETHLVVLSNRHAVQYIQDVIQAGASGFFLQNDQLDEVLIPGLQAILRGGMFLSPRASKSVMAARSLSIRERDMRVLKLMAQGLTTLQIAEEIGLSNREIYRSHSRLREALDVERTAQIVDAARRQGLLDTS